MTQQTEAQRLAEMNENKGNRLQPFIEDNEFTEFGYRPEGLRQEQSDLFASAAELRRLEAVNAQLLDSVQVAVDSDLGRLWVWPETAQETWMKNARTAIKAAKGEA